MSEKEPDEEDAGFNILLPREPKPKSTQEDPQAGNEPVQELDGYDPIANQGE